MSKQLKITVKAPEKKGTEVIVLDDDKEKVTAPSRALGLIKGKVSRIKVRLVDPFGVTGSANAAYTTVFPLVLGGTTEFSSFAAIFDEVKVHSVELFDTLVVTNSGGIGTRQMSSYAWSFEPTTNTALTGVSQAMEADQNTGPRVAMTPAVHDDAAANATVTQGNTVASTYQMTKSGYHVHKFKIPTHIGLNPGTSAEIVGGGWVSTQDTAAICGYLKPYVEALGANNVANIYGFVAFNVEFRSRK